MGQGAGDTGTNKAHWLPIWSLLGTHRSGLNPDLGQEGLLEEGTSQLMMSKYQSHEGVRWVFQGRGKLDLERFRNNDSLGRGPMGTCHEVVFVQ